MSTNDPAHLGETLILPAVAMQPARERPAAILVEGSGPGLNDETASLLRRRLRTASLLLSSGLFVFWLYRVFLLHELTSSLHWFVFVCHTVTMLVTGFMGWRLCSSCPHATKYPRVTELIIFGGCGAFFASVSYSALVDGAAHGYIASTAPMWMTLMFTYALFIPNTWQRAALVIGAIAVTAMTLLLWVKFTTDGLDVLITEDSYLKQGVIDNLLVQMLSASIAIWGVYAMNSLRREAFEARRLGQYQLRRKLGAGGMGEVYLAEHLLLKRPCAIKVIRGDRAGDASAMARFEREVRATAQLTHWNTVEIYDYGHANDGTFYYVMEYLPGMNLDDLVRMHGPLHPDRIVHLLTQTCDALREAHDQGLIHRDIKPANIFAAQRGGIYDVAKLLDFGLARPVAFQGDLQITQDGTITGSPLFMSPEQAVGEPPDERTDIYSLGAVAWFLATGHAPFEDANPLKVIVAHAHDVPRRPSELNPEIPTELDTVIMQCLEKRPQDRPQSASKLRELLQAISTTGEWSDAIAAKWWTCHGCPQKKKLDVAVLAGEIE